MILKRYVSPHNFVHFLNHSNLDQRTSQFDNISLPFLSANASGLSPSLSLTFTSAPFPNNSSTIFSFSRTTAVSNGERPLLSLRFKSTELPLVNNSTIFSSPETFNFRKLSLNVMQILILGILCYAVI